VSATLANGPDPDADPVGYAEAQVLPLRQVHTSDGQLTRALDELSAAYQQFVTTDGNHAAQVAVTRAAGAVNAVCPGAAT